MKNINLMKKFLIPLTVSLSVLSASFSATNAEIVMDTGDINFDGKVDLTDLSELSLALIGDTTLTEEQNKACDFNENGKADITDLAHFRQYLSKVITSLKYEDIKESKNQPNEAVPTANPVDKTDYSKVERDEESINSGFSGAREATAEQIEASKNQPDKAAPTANPVDKTDYSKVERDESAIAEGFGGLLEATAEQIEASKNQPDKAAMAIQ